MSVLPVPAIFNHANGNGKTVVEAGTAAVLASLLPRRRDIQ
jgi:hypothetical protein